MKNYVQNKRLLFCWDFSVLHVSLLSCALCLMFCIVKQYIGTVTGEKLSQIIYISHMDSLKSVPVQKYP